ncbi:MAG: antitoxin family protein [Rhodoferax sp.]|uniref:antitoxin family protein n=1 Tax=Rhodoferax sp. TaxID=50421 RepID=UPI0032665311
MYQAIEAVSLSGVIQPLEPVVFDENEQLVILRISKSIHMQAVPQAQPADWKQWVGTLKASPHLNGDPVDIQQAMRHEWD